jgi:hypothetical protein
VNLLLLPGEEGEVTELTYRIAPNLPCSKHLLMGLIPMKILVKTQNLTKSNFETEFLYFAQIAWQFISL